ncbi:MAG: 16S rRNA (adenine(1518)-N(6)/adenine(1519)-N(6))-dimethyltransferase RsmA [Clostridia bacterium]|nr:16S rRNA (adenine(1518)-N(6)/adenine(1519)-N(6))-dimethyltransferase RsmA [Clostridia bacterium]
MNLEEETKFLIKKYHITANKSLGQNFLISEQVVKNIIEGAEITKEDIVIEIGPGLGTLTKELLEKAKRVIAIELDERMIAILQERFALYHNFEIIKKDVLKIDFDKLVYEQNIEKENIKIVANLPYYITTPIIMKLLEEKAPVESITIMIQKEVAQRLIELPGQKNAGAITYCVYYYCESESITVVPKSSFIPEPQVESQVIKLNIRKQPPVKLENEKLFFKLVKASFMQRRKTLLNGLSNNKIADKQTIKQLLISLDLPENVRGEDLSIEQFASLANKLNSIK